MKHKNLAEVIIRCVGGKDEHYLRLSLCHATALCTEG